MDRLQKIIASCTSYSRRKAEELISQGRVSVDGRTAKLGDRADLHHHKISIDGTLLKERYNLVYYLLNKPRGYLCTVTDPSHRPTVLDLVKTKERIYPVGRLDMYSMGLVILTNDGEMAYKVTHAGRHCPKVYLAKVNGIPDSRKTERLQRGVTVDGERFGPCLIQKMRSKPQSYTWFKVTLFEGKKRQIRRMFEAVNHEVFQLKRVAIGLLTDAGLPVGQCRLLTEKEVHQLKHLQVESRKRDARPKK